MHLKLRIKQSSLEDKLWIVEHRRRLIALLGAGVLCAELHASRIRTESMDTDAHACVTQAGAGFADAGERLRAVPALAASEPRDNMLLATLRAIQEARSAGKYDALIKYRASYKDIVGTQETSALLREAALQDPITARNELTEADIPHIWEQVCAEAARREKAGEWPTSPPELINTTEASEALRAALEERHRRHERITSTMAFTDADQTENMLRDASFQSVIASSNLVNTNSAMYSTAEAVVRRLDDQHRESSPACIAETTEDVLLDAVSIKTRELFGPSTSLILMTHEETRFDPKPIIDLYRAAGGDMDAVFSLKGLDIHHARNQNKARVLGLVAASKGPTTFCFSGHGGEERIYFAAKKSDTVGSISYEELADALITSGNLSEFNIILASCYSTDFAQNLFAELGRRGAIERPAITIAAANEASYAYNAQGLERVYADAQINPFGPEDALLNLISMMHRAQTPVTVGHVLLVESRAWFLQDTTFMTVDGQFR